MESFKLGNQVRLGISEALLLLYRYLTGIYALGDLSFVHFLGGYVRGRKRSLDSCRILTVSGNGIGELEKALCLQSKLDRLDTMAVTPAQMRIMRFLMGASGEEVAQFFRWAQACLRDYSNLHGLLSSSGLVPYWQQQCEMWESPVLKGRVHLFGGGPWDFVGTETYDAILLSHAQKLLCLNDGKLLLSRLKPGGWLTALMPVIFRREALHEQMPGRFSDSPAVKAAKQRMEAEANRRGYEVDQGRPQHIRWTPCPDDIVDVVSFSITSPLRSLLIGELLIHSLAAELPDEVRLALLESAIADVPEGAGAGTETLVILLLERGDL